MSSRADQVAAAGLPDLAEALAARSEEIQSGNPETLDALARIAHVAGVAASVVRWADPELVNQDALDGMHAILSAGRDLLASVESTPDDAAHIGQLVAIADRINASLRDWPTPTAQGQFEDFRMRLAGLRSHLSRIEGEANQQLQDLRTSIEAATADVLRAREEGTNAIRQSSEEATVALAERTEELSARIAEAMPRLDAAIQRNEAQFSESENERRRTFTEDLAQLKVDAEAWFSELVDETLARINTHDEVARLAVEATTRSAHEARELVGVIGNTGMTGGYQQRADSERKSMWWLRAVTLIFGLGAVGVLSAAILTGHDKSIVNGRIGPLALSVLLGALASYCAKQASGHRRNADHAREKALQLASLPAYVQTLDDPRRKEVLEAFAFLLFPGDAFAGSDVDQESHAVSPAGAAREAAMRFFRRTGPDPKIDG